MNINLLFCCKIFINSESKNEQYQILIKTIKSYQFIKFNKVYIYIDIETELENKVYRNELKLLINKTFNNSKIKIFHYRPNSLIEWKKLINSVSSSCNENEPFLVTMNHDHIFIDYIDNFFENNIKKIFYKEDSYKKVFSYSHILEFINYFFYYNKEYTYYKETSILEGQNIDYRHELSCVHVMSLKTLKHIFNSMRKYPNYIGRYDWDGISYHKLNLKSYGIARHFLIHYSGYNHITTMNSINNLSLFDRNEIKKIFIGKRIDQITDLYFLIWKSIFLFSLKEKNIKLFNINFFLNLNFDNFLKRSLVIFKEAYLDIDSDYFHLNLSQTHEIQKSLINKINKNKLLIFEEIKNDYFFMNTKFFRKITLLIRIFLPKRLNIYIDKLRYLLKNNNY